jgi:ribulose-phosphate 3-epimerase
VLNPSTPAVAVEAVLGDPTGAGHDGEPGGGQAYIPECARKVRQLRELADARGLSLEIEVDGGLKPGTARDAGAAGANVFVAGTAVFGEPDYAKAIAVIREEARAAQAAGNPG